MKFRQFFRDHKSLIIVMIFFALIFSSISLVNHYNFRTYARDLGIKNNEIYDYAHLRFNECTLLPFHFENKLSDHFSLLPILVSPLYYVLGTYTLLIFQILSLLFGGLGVYKLILLLTKSRKTALWAMIHFFTLWGIYSALAFDYHDNVPAAMFVPWFIYFVNRQKWAWSAFFMVLVWISKENMALWMFFICLSLISFHLRQKKQLSWLIGFSLLSLVYFILVLNVFIPKLSSTDLGYAHFKYDALGSGFGEAIKTIITRPFFVLSLLFVNHSGDAMYNGIKLETWLAFIISGGFATLLKPRYFIMLIPIFAQKMFNNDFQIWGVNFQYSIEFAPVISIALFLWIHELKSARAQKTIAMAMIVVSFGTSFQLMQSRVSKWYKPLQQRFYSPDHYKRDFDVKKVHEVLNTIPGEAKVSAQSMLVPQLAFRDKVYHYPDVQDADYIVLLLADKNTWYASKETYDQLIQVWDKSPNWEVYYSDEALLIYKRMEK